MHTENVKDEHTAKSAAEEARARLDHEEKADDKALLETQQEIDQLTEKLRQTKDTREMNTITRDINALLKKKRRLEAAAKQAEAADEAAVGDIFDTSPKSYAFATEENAWYRKGAGGGWGGAIKDKALDRELTNLGLAIPKQLEAFKSQCPVVQSVRWFPGDTSPIACEEGELYLNTYLAPTLSPQQGDWAPIREVLLNLCGGVPEYVEWVLDQLAWHVQGFYGGNPQLPGVADLFYGPQQGAGKNVLGRVLRALFGKHNWVTIGQNTLAGAFNKSIARKGVICANEVVSGNNRDEENLNKVKHWIADDPIQISGKHVDDLWERNVGLWLFFSNSFRPIKMELMDRRFAVFKILKKLARDLGKLVGQDADQNGPIVRALLHHLLEREVKLFRPFEALDTPWKHEMSYDTANAAEKFVLTIKGDGFDSVIGPWQKKLAAAYRDGPFSDPGSHEPWVKIHRNDPAATAVVRSTFMDIFGAWCRNKGYQVTGETTVYKVLLELVREVTTDTWVWHDAKSERAIVGLPRSKSQEDVDPVGAAASPQQGAHRTEAPLPSDSPVFTQPEARA